MFASGHSMHRRGIDFDLGNIAGLQSFKPTFVVGRRFHFDRNRTAIFGG